MSDAASVDFQQELSPVLSVIGRAIPTTDTPESPELKITLVPLTHSLANPLQTATA